MIKVLRLGQPVQEVHRNGSRTVGELLQSIGSSLGPNEEVRINGAAGNNNTPLPESATLMIVPAVKGGVA
jgi:hypothetical protein